MIPPSSPAAPPPDDLLARARQGDQAAWQALFEDCYPKIVRVVRNRLSRPLRRYYDSTDIANSVMKSLAAKFDRFDFSTVDGLKAFLVRAAEQKLIDGNRYVNAKRRDGARNRPLAHEDAEELLADTNTPTASQIAVATEGEQQLLDGHEGEEREVLRLRLQGYTTQEVAETIGWHERRVQRFLKNVRLSLPFTSREKRSG